MIKLPTLLVSALVAAASGFVFRTSYDVQALEERLSTLNAEILQEQESIRVLRAEWAYLNQPARLRELGAKFSPLAPMTQDQIIASLDEIPMPLPGAPEMPGIPLPGRKPDGATPTPLLVAERSGAVEEVPEAPVPQAPAVVQTAALPAPPGNAVDVVLASFRREQASQEAAR